MTAEKTYVAGFKATALNIHVTNKANGKAGGGMLATWHFHVREKNTVKFRGK